MSGTDAFAVLAFGRVRAGGVATQLPPTVGPGGQLTRLETGERPVPGLARRLATGGPPLVQVGPSRPQTRPARRTDRAPAAGQGWGGAGRGPSPAGRLRRRRGPPRSVRPTTLDVTDPHPVSLTQPRCRTPLG